MFNSHAHNLTFPINVDINIFAYLLCLLDIFVREFNVGSIRIGKLFHFHVLFLFAKQRGPAFTLDIDAMISSIGFLRDLCFDMRTVCL